MHPGYHRVRLRHAPDFARLLLLAGRTAELVQSTRVQAIMLLLLALDLVLVIIGASSKALQHFACCCCFFWLSFVYGVVQRAITSPSVSLYYYCCVFLCFF